MLVTLVALIMVLGWYWYTSHIGVGDCVQIVTPVGGSAVGQVTDVSMIGGVLVEGAPLNDDDSLRKVSEEWCP